MARFLPITLVLILFFAGAFAVSWQHEGQKPTRTSYSIHGVINIIGDLALTAIATSESWPGTGSVGNPYVIRDYDINGAGNASAISIQDTTKYFVIQNCYVHGANNAGIYLSNVTHAELTGDVCSANLYGIYLSSSNGSSINDCVCSSNGNSDILISSSGYTVVDNTTCSSNQQAGIYSEYSENITISNNIFNGGSSYGIYVYSAANSLIANNVCTNNYNGIYVTSCSDNIFIGNTCTGGQYGIYMRFSDNNAFSLNNCSSSSTGLYTLSCDGNTYQKCSFWSNSGYGVMLDTGSMSNRFSNNTFALNNGATSEYDPSYVQAGDVGTNSWNSAGSPHGWGNYWHDWTTPDSNSDGIVDFPYNLSGSVKDNYPLASDPVTEIPEFGSVWLLATVFGLLATVFLFSRSKKS